MRTSATTSTININLIIEFKNHWTQDDNHEDDNANESFDALNSILCLIHPFRFKLDVR